MQIGSGAGVDVDCVDVESHPPPQASRVEMLTSRQENLAGLIRGTRAAIVVPSLFALGLLVKQPQMAGFTVFGTFAHLVMVNYSAVETTRLMQAALLTGFGSLLMSLGTLASANTWTAVAGAAAAGFLSESPLLVRGSVAVSRTALLLSFMLATAVPAPLRFVLPQLAGWLLAGAVAQVALHFLWISIRPISAENEVVCAGPTNAGQWLGNAVRTGLAMSLASLAARILGLNHAFWVVLGVLPVLSARGMSPTRTFWREQAGTLLGFLAGACLVAALGAHEAWYWIALSLSVFFSAYASTAIGFAAGQAGFTVFAVILFCILTPLQKRSGIVRVEDIAIGGLLSLLIASGAMSSACRA